MGANETKPLARREHALPELTHQSMPEALRLYYRAKILPTEILVSYDVFGSPPMLDAEFTCPPAVLVVGEYSVGKTTMVNHFLNMDYLGSRTGPEPTTDSFCILSYGKEQCQLPASTMISDVKFPYQGLNRFGASFLSRCFSITCPCPLLRHLVIIDTPGILTGEKQARSRPYDYDLVLQYFAEKVDSILFMFDTAKFDMCEEVKRILLNFQAYEEKLLIVMNKADMCDTLGFNRVKGSLTWNLSRTLQTVDVPRVYCGSFWDQPLQNLDNRELIEQDTRDLCKELRLLTYSIHTRRLIEVTQRATQALLFALIFNELHARFAPCCFSLMKKRVARCLVEEIYPDVIRNHKFSSADLPPIPVIHQLLNGGQDGKIPKIEEGAIQDLDEFLTVDVQRFLNVLPPEGSIAANYGRLAESPLYAQSEKFDWCAVDEAAERHGWRREFQRLKPLDGLVGPEEVTPMMEGSGLSHPLLDQIWRLADDDYDDLVNEDEYCLIKFLLKRTVDGHSIPDELDHRARPPRKHVMRHCMELERNRRMHENMPAKDEPLLWQLNQRRCRWDSSKKDDCENAHLKEKAEGTLRDLTEAFSDKQ
uniref:EH domain-containing protein n=1 Tax=Trichuris muris TaxID=70415 RepID=A0A5S6QKD4_TRIMR